MGHGVMKKTVVFEWDGQSYTIDKVRFAKSEAFFEAQESMAKLPLQSEQVRTAIVMLKMLNCPQDVIDDVAVDEVEELLDALSRAHFNKHAKGDVGPPESAENPLP